MSDVRRTDVNEDILDQLLGLGSSKIGFYAEVKQKIQELEAANLGLRTKRSELQAIFDAISDGVVIFDGRGVIQHRNHVCPRMFPRETLVGKSCRALFHPDRKSSPESCPVERALKGDNFQISFASSREDGKTGYYDVTATPIEDPSGQSRALLFIRDVTSKRHQDLQLAQAEKMSSLGVLAAGVAHEINNPLTSIAGYAEALVRRFRHDPELGKDERLGDFPHYLDVIVREAYRCKGIIDGLLSFSRKSNNTLEPVNLNQIIQEVLELVRLKARHEKIRFEERWQEDLPPVNGDAAALRQVFMNLIMNAMQAIDGEGLLEITTASKGAEIFVQVKDSGQGIPEEILEKIWNPFFTTKEVGQGVGLGLAITYNIVQRHQGDIRVESRAHEGSTFTVKLPAFEENV